MRFKITKFKFKFERNNSMHLHRKLRDNGVHRRISAIATK